VIGEPTVNLVNHGLAVCEISWSYPQRRIYIEKEGIGMDFVDESILYR